MFGALRLLWVDWIGHVYVQKLAFALLHACIPASASRALMLLCHLSCRLTVTHVPDAALASVFATHPRPVLTTTLVLFA